MIVSFVLSGALWRSAATAIRPARGGAEEDERSLACAHGLGSVVGGLLVALAARFFDLW